LDEKNYLKENPPAKAEVKIRIELLKILEIGEVEMLLRTQFALSLEWFDSRIRFHNLHGDQGLNKLMDEDKQRIWIPSMIFDNTDEKTRTKTDKESLVSIKREGNFSKSTKENVDNIYIYEGEKNPVEINRVYHISWFAFDFNDNINPGYLSGTVTMP
jgi:hypothetical protein